MRPVNLLVIQMLNEMDHGEQQIEEVRPQCDPITDAFDTNPFRCSQGDRGGGNDEQRPEPSQCAVTWSCAVSNSGCVRCH